MKHFWNARRCGVKIHTKINNVYRIIDKCQKWMTILPICVATLFCSRPIFTKNFIFYIWTPWNSKILNFFLLFTQYYFTVLMGPIVFACDLLYLNCSAHVTIQLYLLNRELENMKNGSSKEDIYECIQHHQLMLS